MSVHTNVPMRLFLLEMYLVHTNSHVSGKAQKYEMLSVSYFDHCLMSLLCLCSSTDQRIEVIS